MAQAATTTTDSKNNEVTKDRQAKGNGNDDTVTTKKIGNSDDNDKFLKMLQGIKEIKNEPDLLERLKNESNKKALIDASEGEGGYQKVLKIVKNKEFVNCDSFDIAMAISDAIVNAYPKKQANGMYNFVQG